MISRSVYLTRSGTEKSDDRVFSRVGINSGTQTSNRTTINLAPGDLKKEGPMYDLPIALGILESTGQMSASARFENFTIAGELSLSSAVRAIRRRFSLRITGQGKRSAGSHSSGQVCSRGRLGKRHRRLRRRDPGPGQTFS